MSLSQEAPPQSVDPVLGEWLARRFKQVGNLLRQGEHAHVERRQMPDRPQAGDVYFFGNPATHSYDAAITAEGWWGYKSTGWVQLA